METRQQEQERLFDAMPGTNHLANVVQATEEQRALFSAQAEAQRVETQLHLAELLSRAGAFNGTDRAPKTEAEREQAKYLAFAQIQIGAEIGLKPAQSMRSIMITPQGIDIDIHTRVALAVASGRHDYDIIRHTRNVCEIQWKRKRNGVWEPCPPITADIEQLKHIMIWEYDAEEKKPVRKPITEKWNYREWREDMTYRFAQIRNIRRYAPETQGSFPIAPDDTAEQQSTLRPLPGENGAIARDDLSPPRTDPTLPEVISNDMGEEAYEESPDAVNAFKDDTEDPESTHGQSEASDDPFKAQRQFLYDHVHDVAGRKTPLPRSRFLEEGQTQHLAAYDKLLDTYPSCRNAGQMDAMVSWVKARMAGEEN